MLACTRIHTHLSLSLSLYVYIYIYIVFDHSVCIYIYIHIYYGMVTLGLLTMCSHWVKKCGLNPESIPKLGARCPLGVGVS